MSDVQFLFVILGALYLWECACWLQRDGVAFTQWLAPRWRLQLPATLVGNQRGGFVLAPPLPPLGRIHVAYPFPFSLGPAGVLDFVTTPRPSHRRSNHTGRFWTWEQLTDLRCSGRKLHLGQTNLFAAPTATRAQHLHQNLTTLSTLPPHQRPDAIREILRATLDPAAIENRRRELHHRLRPLRLLANSLFLLIFVLAPALLWFLGLQLVWLPLLLVTLTLTGTTATRFHRVHREFFPAAADDRFTQTLILAFAPASTVRASDLLSRPLLENFHPLAVAQVLQSSAAFRALARRSLLDLRHPTGFSVPLTPSALATETFFRQTQLEVLETWLRQQQISPAELCHPPAPADATCHAYCPRCEAQFTTTAATCADCGGLPLIPFSNPTAQAR
jgi:hypothetical protein